MQHNFLRLNLEVADYDIDDPNAILGLRDDINQQYDKTKTFLQTDGVEVNVLEWLQKYW
jgi:hypothetical protein